MPLEHAPVLTPPPELAGVAVNTQGLVTLGIYAIAAFIGYKIAKNLLKS